MNLSWQLIRREGPTTAGGGARMDGSWTENGCGQVNHSCVGVAYFNSTGWGNGKEGVSQEESCCGDKPGSCPGEV